MTGPAVPAVFHIRRARDLIDRHFAEPLDLDAMARTAGFSRYHFARGFKAAYGETPGQYLTRRRLERAQDLLRDRGMEAGGACGAGGAGTQQSHRHRDLPPRGVLQPRLVQRAVHRAGRGLADRVPAAARRAGRPPGAGVLPHGVEPAEGAPSGRERNLGEDRARRVALTSAAHPSDRRKHDQKDVPRLLLRARPGPGEGVLHREAGLRAAQRRQHGRRVRGSGRGVPVAHRRPARPAGRRDHPRRLPDGPRPRTAPTRSASWSRRAPWAPG